MLNESISKIIIYPNCNGKGSVTVEKRINAYDTDFLTSQCSYWNGKRVVKETITKTHSKIDEEEDNE